MIDGCPLPHDDVAYAILENHEDPEHPPATCACGLPITYAEDRVVVRIGELLAHRYGGPRSRGWGAEECAASADAAPDVNVGKSEVRTKGAGQIGLFGGERAS